MKTYTRRDFLKRTAGATALGMAAPELLGAEGSAEALQMAVARWKGAKPEDEPKVEEIAEKLTRDALTALGGMKRFVSRGDVVWIKPNISIHTVEQFAANTNPDVVASLCRLCYDAGAGKVKVGDNSAYGADKAYPMSGIEAAVKAVDAEVVYLAQEKFSKCGVNGEFLKDWPVYTEMLAADLLINVPIVKHHALTGVTIGMKNMMGMVGGRRPLWHDAIDTCLADITAFVKPRLNVMDAIRVLVRHGPNGGDMKDVAFKGVVAAGTDVVAIDAAGAELIGIDPTRVTTIQTAHRRGLGVIDFRSLRLKQCLVG